MLVKNADASRKHAQTAAQRQAAALAGQSAPTVQATQSMLATQPSMPNSLATMNLQSFPPGFQGYNPLAGGYFSPNPMLWNMGTAPLSPVPPDLYTNMTAMTMLPQGADEGFNESMTNDVNVQVKSWIRAMTTSAKPLVKI